MGELWRVTGFVVECRLVVDLGAIAHLFQVAGSVRAASQRSHRAGYGSSLAIQCIHELLQDLWVIHGLADARTLLVAPLDGGGRFRRGSTRTRPWHYVIRCSAGRFCNRTIRGKVPGGLLSWSNVFCLAPWGSCSFLLKSRKGVGA